jgi:hypothetical protein
MTRPFLVPALVLLLAAACSSSRTITRVPEPARAPASGPAAAPTAPAEGKVWVCHGNRNTRWQQVSERAAAAHRRHGDQVSTGNRRAGGTCSNG